MNKIVLMLTESEMEKLEEVLLNAWDCGPSGWGYKSDELSRLEAKVLVAIGESKGEGE